MADAIGTLEFLGKKNFCRKSNWAVIAIFSLSWFVLIIGIIMVIFSFNFNDNKVLMNMERENDDIKDGRKFIFTGVVIFSFVTIGLGLFGFFHHCIKHKVFPICYGIILFPSFIFLIVIGAVCIAVSDGAIETIDDECVVVNTNFEKSVELTRAQVLAE